MIRNGSRDRPDLTVLLISRNLFLAGVAALPMVIGAVPPVLAQAGPDLCRAGQDDHHERLAPDGLLQRLGQTFEVAPESLRGSSYVRCASGRLMGCIVGANLNCGPADVSRRSQGATAFCRENPGSDSVPMAATGHDTIYAWHCAGRRAVAGRTVEDVDRLGFMTRNWRLLR